MAIRRLSDACEDGLSCPGIWEDDALPEDVIVVAALLDPSPVPLGPGECAILLPRRVVRDSRIR
ncbi:MAG: hypothetical protein ACRDR6_12300 [Pseudonocardiaceae bacterium]